MGDININLLNDTSTIVVNYTSLLQSYGYESLINVPTRQVPNGAGTLIDHAFSNSLISPQVKVLDIDITDHYPLVLRFNYKSRPCPLPHFKYVLDKESFTTAVANLDWSEVKSCNDPQKAFSKFLSLITSQIQKFTSKKKCKKTLAFSHNPWMSQKLLAALRKRDNLYKKTKSQPFNTKLIARYKKLRNAVNTQLKVAKHSFLERKISQAGNDAKLKWDIVNSFLNRNSRHQVSRIVIENIEYSSPNLIADAFNSYFCSIDSPTPSQITQLSRLPHSFFLFPTTPEEIHDVIQHLKSTGAGIDDVLPANIKIISHLISDILCFITNLIFKTGVFPNELKRGKVIPVLKKGDKTNIQNYRPICILPFFGKVLEKLIGVRLSKYLAKFNILSPCQFGFRSGLSTDLALIHLTDQLKKIIDEGLFAGSVFIDLTKAFDCLNHSILFSKLHAIGVCGPTLSLLKSYLHNRVQVVSVSNTYSRERTTNMGVPQGSILGPLLFLIYINDLPNCLSTSNSILYADDTTIYSSDKNISLLVNRLSTDLENVSSWCSANLLTINATKTKFVIFSSHQKYSASFPSLTFGSHSISPSPCSSFLGISLDSNLKYIDHISHLKKKIAYGIRALIKTRPYFTRATLFSLYYSFVHSHINYGIMCWGNNYNTHLASLQVLQNQSIRIITNSSRFSNGKCILHENNILTISELLKYNLGITFYKYMTNALPPICFSSSNLIAHSNTRFAHNNNVLLPKVRTNYGKQTAEFSSITLWNSLPASIKNLRHLHQFKSELKSHIIQTY
uniref:Tick transposon n=1 Tax=Rhipicephalus zambeziensis TaxID=60191 RepID=A0A224Z9S1_9ACAR